MGLVAAWSFYTHRRMQALLLRLATQLPASARHLATPDRIATLVQFLMFGTVGVVGFLVDTATVYGLRRSLGLYCAGAAAYIGCGPSEAVVAAQCMSSGPASSGSISAASC